MKIKWPKPKMGYCFTEKQNTTIFTLEAAPVLYFGNNVAKTLISYWVNHMWYSAMGFSTGSSKYVHFEGNYFVCGLCNITDFWTILVINQLNAQILVL